MSQSLNPHRQPKVRKRLGSLPFRIIGLALLVVLLIKVDVSQVQRTVTGAEPVLVALAVGIVAPMILVRTARWQIILRAQEIDFSLLAAFLAYFGSVFIGFLTPGRLGEFVKALHVSGTGQATVPAAFSTVLSDRLFDLYALILVGAAALVALTSQIETGVALVGAVVLASAPLVVFIHPRSYGFLRGIWLRLGRPGIRLFSDGGWLHELRQGLCQLNPIQFCLSASLTLLAYLMFFGQCYVLALALQINAGFLTITYTVALGSLVTLLPISISGLGTREATMIAYLGAQGVPAVTAISFSLLVFFTFYVAGGLMGAVAWWIKPVEWTASSQTPLDGQIG